MTTQQTRGTKTTGQVKSYPAARQLATPTDLTEAEAQAICMQTQDFHRAYHAFVKKEKPQFQGD